METLGHMHVTGKLDINKRLMTQVAKRLSLPLPLSLSHTHTHTHTHTRAHKHLHTHSKTHAVAQKYFRPAGLQSCDYILSGAAENQDPFHLI